MKSVPFRTVFHSIIIAPRVFLHHNFGEFTIAKAIMICIQNKKSRSV